MLGFAERLKGSLVRRLRRLRQSILVHPDALYTLHEQEHLRRILQYLKVDCVFDVGANVGQYALMLRKKAKFVGRIISFEPIPRLADELRQVAHSDGLWDIQQIALASESEQCHFNVMAGDQFSSLCTPSVAETARFADRNIVKDRIVVQTETLESAYTRLRNKYGFERPFLKMDTQGFDVRILQSGESIASRFVGLQSELSIKKIYKEAVDFREATQFYNRIGFELSAFIPNNSGHFPQLIETDCIMVRSDLMPHDSLVARHKTS